MILTAIAGVSLVGMSALTLDVGMLLSTQARLQNATDAAVLAAAAYLPTDSSETLESAENTAIQYADLNGFMLNPSDIAFATGGVANDTVQIQSATTVKLAFAPVLGPTEGTPDASASAQVGTISDSSGVMPFGVEQQDFEFGTEYCLKLGAGSCGGAHQGNFHALDIDDTGTDSASEYEDRIRDGSSVDVHIGDVKNVVSGNMAGPTRHGTGCQGHNGRLTGDNDTFDDVVQANGDGTFTVLNWESPRLVLVPVVEFDGNVSATVEGFAAFVIEGCSGGDAVVGRFIQTVWPGAHWGPLTGTNDFGARSVRLTS